MTQLKHFLLTGALCTTFLAQAQDAPFFVDGEAQIVPGFENPDEWIREDLWVETSFDTDGDGKPDRMHVDVTRPAQTNDGLQLPVIYETSPYYAGTAGNDPELFWNVKHEIGEVPAPPKHVEVVRRGQRPVISNSQVRTWVPRGYIVVHSSSPGTGLSDGSPTVGGDNESLAPMAVIEWLAGKENGYKDRTGDEKVHAFWSTGNVGMTGTSYNGTLPLAAATTGIDALKAIIPVAPNTSYYHYYRSNGLVRSPGGYLGEDIDVLYEFIHSGDESKRAYGNKTIRDEIMREQMDRATGDYNAFWAGRDYLNDMAPMKAALLMSHGFNDWNVMPEHSYRIYNKAREMGLPVQIYYHQGGHGGPPPISMMNKWFTRYLFEIENGVEQDPKAWIVREGDDRLSPTPYADYPNPQAEDVVLHLTKGGNTQGGLTTDKGSRKKEMLIDNVAFAGEYLARVKNSPNRLLYTTPILSEGLHISGTASITLSLSSSVPAANLSVWLVSLPWNDQDEATIYDNIITRGWADPQNHESIYTSQPLEPGVFYDLTFELQPDDQIIPAGQQIGLMIFSSDQEFTLHPKPGTELTIDLKRSSLTLPIVGGLSEFENAVK
ncbi:MAG: Xaa-Pro dipeptidyl-peptidase [Schleiferiaceae bacterium]